MNYEKLINDFSWEDAKRYYRNDPKGSFNIGIEACDRWAEEEPNRLAIYWDNGLGESEEWTYKKLREKSNQAANAFQSLGIKPGDRVAGLLEKDTELFVTILATFKLGAIYVPLFPAFAEDAIMHRVTDAGVSLLVTNSDQNEKFSDTEINFTRLLIDQVNDEHDTFWDYINTFSTDFEVADTNGEAPAILQYTSGTTGLPKGAVMKHNTVFVLYPYFAHALHLEADDVFFCGADLGWSYGLGPGFLGPLCLGVKNVMYKGGFSVEKTFEMFEKYEVTNVAHAPTGYRMLMAVGGSEALDKYDIKVKKFSSAGEPLDADVINFFTKHYGRSIYDHYGTTEAGLIISNYNITDMETKAGSMGLPSPGFDIKLLDENGEEVEKGEIGQIAINTKGNYFSFKGYWENEAGTREKIINDYYLTGDLAKVDDENYYW